MQSKLSELEDKLRDCSNETKTDSQTTRELGCVDDADSPLMSCTKYPRPEYHRAAPSLGGVHPTTERKEVRCDTRSYQRYETYKQGSEFDADNDNDDYDDEESSDEEGSHYSHYGDAYNLGLGDEELGNALLERMNISSNLLQSLGIQDLRPVETDWTPPSKPGLDNSDSIIK